MKPLNMWEYSALLEEAQQKIVKKYLKKIYQIDKKLFRFDFGEFSLIVQLGQYFYLTKNPPSAPQNPSNFIMLLRKYINSKKLEKFYQFDFDRYYILEFSNKNKLIIEQFAKGNMILLDENDKILSSFYPTQVEKKSQYLYPQAKEFDLAVFIGKKYNLEDKDKPKHYCIYNNEPFLVCPNINTMNTEQIRTFSSFSEAVEFAAELENKKIKNPQEDKENKELLKLYKRLEEQQKILLATKQQINDYQKIIYYIENNSSKIEQLILKAISEGKKTIKLKIED